MTWWRVWKSQSSSTQPTSRDGRSSRASSMRHVVELVVQGGLLLDATTGTVFDPVLGLAVEGPLQGEALDQLPATTIFPDDFASSWPEGNIYEAEN